MEVIINATLKKQGNNVWLLTMQPQEKYDVFREFCDSMKYGQISNRGVQFMRESVEFLIQPPGRND